ncbi:MAG: helix-turn-helix domain-containing protein [Clostridia bacterium]|nr:helix-turn-helix domain-containing protein [Clostridia bacterium]
MSVFAERTKKLMVENKINQKELSKLSGVSEPSLCRYLQGNIMPRMDVIINVANALGVSQDYLIGGNCTHTTTTDPYVETRTVVMRNRGQLSSDEKMNLLRILFEEK